MEKARRKKPAKVAASFGEPKHNPALHLAQDEKDTRDKVM
jgi:hypothetical protein